MGIVGRMKAAFSALQGRVGEALTSASSSFGRRATGPRIGDQWLEAYNTMPWLRATLSKIAFGVASLEWGIVRTMGPGGKTTRRKDLQRAQGTRRHKALSAMVDSGDAEAIFDHPALDLLEDPCPLLEGKAFWTVAQVYFEIPGEVFLLVERGGPPGPTGRPQPTALYPIPPTWVTRTPTPDRPTFDIEKGTLIITDIPNTEMWWMKNPDPVNPYARGAGSALSLADELDADESAAKMFSWSFRNRGQGDKLVSLEGAQKKELNAFRDAWNANLMGVQNALKTHFVNWKVNVQELGQNFEHLQVMDFRQFSRDMLRQVHGIPPELLGITESSNRATIEAADFIFGKHVIMPRAEMWREFLQERLAPEYDERAILDYVSPLQEDKDFALKVVQSAPHILKANEHRRLAGFDPITREEGGELFFVNGQFVASLADAEPPAAPGLPGAPGPGAPSGGSSDLHRHPGPRPARRWPGRGAGHRQGSEDSGRALEGPGAHDHEPGRIPGDREVGEASRVRARLRLPG